MCFASGVPPTARPPSGRRRGRWTRWRRRLVPRAGCPLSRLAIPLFARRATDRWRKGNAMLRRRRKSSVLFVLIQLYCLLLSGIIGITLGLLLVALLMPDHPMIDELRAALNSFLPVRLKFDGGEGLLMGMRLA